MRIEEKLKLAIRTLETIQNWSEEDEELWEDFSACAKQALDRIKQ